MSTQLQALELWRRSLVTSVRGDNPDLSARQQALLLSVYLEKGPHTVRGLAKALNVSKPAVSRALDRLGELGYIRRERDDLDRRNVLVQRTDEGAAYLTGLSEIICAAEKEVAQISEQQPLSFALEALEETAAALNMPSSSESQPTAALADVAA